MTEPKAGSKSTLSCYTPNPGLRPKRHEKPRSMEAAKKESILPQMHESAKAQDIFTF